MSRHAIMQCHGTPFNLEFALFTVTEVTQFHPIVMFVLRDFLDTQAKRRLVTRNSP